MTQRRNVWCSVLLTYAGIFISFSLFFFLLFHTPLFNFEKVLFYRGIFLLSLTTFIFFSICFICIHFKHIDHVESTVAAIVVSVAINLSVFITLPVTIERSLTSYMLTSLALNSSSKPCRGLTEKQLHEQFISDYFIKKGAVSKRINEQTIINFIGVQKQCFHITKKGLLFLDLSQLVRKIYAF